MTDPTPTLRSLADLSADSLAMRALIAADDLGEDARHDLAYFARNGEWWWGDRRRAGWGPPRHLAEGYPDPDVDGFVARVHRGVTRDELPGVIGFLIAVLAAQEDDGDE